MGSQVKILSRGSHQPLHLGSHEKLCRDALNLKIGKRDISKKRAERGVTSTLSRGAWKGLGKGLEEDRRVWVSSGRKSKSTDLSSIGDQRRLCMR